MLAWQAQQRTMMVWIISPALWVGKRPISATVSSVSRQEYQTRSAMGWNIDILSTIPSVCPEFPMGRNSTCLGLPSKLS